ncbi:MAG: aldo/keto reductase, partial [Ruminococcaceae bacterium]|nr:aldo/keto reductase [Oscillospiraceae bacterium]
MNYKTLGKTGLSVSAVGFGGIPIQRITKEEARPL